MSNSPTEEKGQDQQLDNSPTQGKGQDPPLDIDCLLEELNTLLATLVAKGWNHSSSESPTYPLAVLACARALVDQWQEHVALEASAGRPGSLESPQDIKVRINLAWRDAMATQPVIPESPSRSRMAGWRVSGPGRLHRYHAGGNLIVGAGVVAGVIAYGWGLASPWAGFLAGAVPTWFLAALAHTFHDARA